MVEATPKFLDDYKDETDMYVEALIQLDLRYERLEEKRYEDFVRMHSEDLTKAQVDLLREMNDEHISYIEAMDREQEEKIAELGIANVNGIAYVFNKVGGLLMKHDDFLYDQVRKNDERFGKIGPMLGGSLQALYKKEVETWADPESKIHPNAMDYLRELGEINKRFGLEALNPKIGVPAPTPTRSKTI